MSDVPESLQLAELGPVWAAVRRHLDRRGTESLGTIATPVMSSDAALSLRSVLGRRVGVRLDLARLENGLVGLGVGGGLDDALAVLGAPPSTGAIERRAATARKAEIVHTIGGEVHRWPEAWVGEWADGLLRSGQFSDVGPGRAREVVRSVRRLVDHRGELVADDLLPVSRTDVAARLFGDSHALDDGGLLERAARRALMYVVEETETVRAVGAHPFDGEGSVDVDGPVDGRALWVLAGFVTDHVSAPALTWNLPIHPASAIGAITTAATVAGSPVHVSQFVLHRHPVEVAGSAPVLLVENPRVVEAAAERTVNWGVIATNGNPSGAVTMLVDALLISGTEIRHHGDFDPAGLAIVGRLAERGCRPWMMDAGHYRHALSSIDERGMTVPIASGGCGPTSWDPELQACFDSERRIIHEELVLDDLLDPHLWNV